MVALELDFLGRPEDSKRVMDRALAWFAALPADTLRGERGQAFYWAERWYDADTLFAALLERVPSNFPAERLIVPRGHRGVTLAHLGHHDEALEVERWLAQLDRPYLRGANTRWRAAIHAALGDRQEAVRLLQQAYSEKMPLGTAQRREPEWRTLRDYGPYREFVRPKE
jgi:tetratricopeptide (TPR) repeat protein